MLEKLGKEEEEAALKGKISFLKRISSAGEIPSFKSEQRAGQTQLVTRVNAQSNDSGK